jgi:LPPG:FO 2-phospho-L-lactate transferase
MNPTESRPIKVVALAGGVGGARLADGLAQVLPPEDLTIVVNTGDDFEHFGLYICPDLDTVCYTLAGLVNPVNGWGRSDETWRVLETVEFFGGPAWFRLGDRDLGLHLERTRRRHAGQPLSQIVQHFCQVLGIRPRVLPMTDDFTPTWVYTTDGEMPFQEYFVRRQCQPIVTGFRFQGADRASPAPGVLDAIRQADLVVLCPSNPWVSLDPILSIPGLRSVVAVRPVVAVSPIIGGQTVKGPAGKMFAELGILPSAAAVARHYADLLNGFVIDQMDAGLEPEIQELGMQTLLTDIIMKTPLDRVRLSKEVIDFGTQLII